MALDGKAVGNFAFAACRFHGGEGRLEGMEEALVRMGSRSWHRKGSDGYLAEGSSALAFYGL